MVAVINVDRTAVGGPSPRGVVVAVDLESTWYFIVEYGDEVRLIIPMPKADALGYLVESIRHTDFNSIGTHAGAMARALDMDYRVIESQHDLQEFVTDGLIIEANGVTPPERESLTLHAEMIDDLIK